MTATVPASRSLELALIGNCTVGALRKQAEGWDVSVVSRGIKASATGVIDLVNFSGGDDSNG